MWVIMDLAAREIKRDKFLDYFGLEMLKERALGKGVGRLRPAAGAELVCEKEMKFSDIDYNRHVNNAKYVDFIMDSFSYDFHQENEVKAFEIHYINEIGAGDALLLRRSQMESENGNLSFYIDGVRGADGMSVINAVVEWGEPA
jgi:acyl-ACP thioesterase